MMKTLIYKDWILSRKYYLTSVIFCTIIAVIFLLIRISMNCGNLADNEEIRISLGRNMYILRYVPCLIFILSFTGDHTISGEESCGFIRFFRTTPAPEKKFIASKMLFILIMLSSVLVISVIYNVILCAASGEALTLHILSNIASIYFFCMGVSFIDVMMFAGLRKRQVILIIKTVVLTILYLLFGIYTFIRLDELSEKADIDLFDFFRNEYGGILNNIFPITLIFAAVAAVLSYFVSVRLIKRRES